MRPVADEGEALLGATEVLAATCLVLARAFAGGATLWCVAPGAAHHAHHVAVEFVHPVIVGKRSLPSVAIDGEDPVGLARLLVRPGDVLLAIGDADDPVIAALLLRGEAWGVQTMLLAIGDRPSSVTADHVVWAGAEGEGGLPLAYHLLWELTHVVFEHPGLLRIPAPQSCDDEVCITCSDEGRVVEVRSIDDECTALVLAGGHEELVDISVVSDVRPGDLLLVHAGLALTVLDAGVRP